MNSYIDDLLVWALIFAVLIPLLIILIKRKRSYIRIAGVLTILGSLPAAFMTESSISGCCGSPKTGQEGLGYLIGVAVAILGITIVLYSNKSPE